MEWTQEDFTVTTDLSRFDMNFVVASLQELWRKGASPDKIARAFGNSLCFGLFDGQRQIGCVRAVTDHEFVSWICDLYLDQDYRGKGLGLWLMDCVKSHPDLIDTRLVFTSVPESEAFYRHIGYVPMKRGYAMPPRKRNADA